MTKSDVVQLVALAAAVLGVSVLTAAFLGVLAAIGAGAVVASWALWLVGRELDMGADE